MRPGYFVGHLDADCFYVSAERARDAFLFGKPVGVLGNQGACVIAKSYEMKARGVKTGMPIWEAIVKCPEGIYIKRDFRWYEVLSRQMLEVVREFSPAVEYYSIDEFFFQAIPLHGLTLQHLAEEMRDAVFQRVGVPVTVGIARTKTLAKLFSDTAKPFGARAVMDRNTERELLTKLPVTEISGIAARRAARLAPYGITRCVDFADADRRFIRKLLTVTGEGLWYELNGDPIRPIQTTRPPHKMISRGGSFGKWTDDPHKLYAWLVRNLERLIEELEFYAVRTGHITIWLAYRNGQVGVGDARLEVPTDRFDLLLASAKPALRRAWIPHVPATRLHIIATDLQYRGSIQLGLFDPPSERAEAIAKVKREINAHHGRFALRSGVTLYLEEIYRDDAHDYDICDVRGKICF